MSCFQAVYSIRAYGRAPIKGGRHDTSSWLYAKVMFGNMFRTKPSEMDL